MSDDLIQTMMTPNDYATFVSDHAAYAREVALIKRFALEDEESVFPSPQKSYTTYNFRS